ncbi:DNA-binding ATPase [Bacillus phage vB_BcgM]|nr:DNA-binding ATPase [Bacillus phage vB_BcgM]
MSITTIILLNTTMLLATASVNAVQCLIIMKELKRREE